MNTAISNPAKPVMLSVDRPFITHRIVLMSRVTRCVEPGKYHEVYFAIAFPELGDRHHYSLQRLTGSTTVETFFEGCDLKRTQWNSIRSRKARLDHGGSAALSHRHS